MPNRLSVKSGILRWLVSTMRFHVKSSDIEEDFVKWYRYNHGPVSVSSAARRWRELRGVDGPLTVAEVSTNPQGSWNILAHDGIDFSNYMAEQNRRTTHG